MIKILCVGRLKEKYWVDSVSEYAKRLSKYTKLEVIEVLDEKTDDAKVALRKEGERLEKYIQPKDFVITLEIGGKELSSLEFSKELEILQMQNSSIVFVIGGSCGLDASIRERSDIALSFSKFTFPHQLFRVMLLEQLYRAYKILNHEQYHK